MQSYRFKGQPPKFCTRGNNQKCDVEVSSVSDSVSSFEDSGKKRKYVDLTKDDYADIFKRDAHETGRDKSIAEYFYLESLETITKSTYFANLSAEVQLKVKNKYEAYVKKLMDND